MSRSALPKLDLRPITRYADRCLTLIHLLDNNTGAKHEWIQAGMSSIRTDSRTPWISAFLPEGMLDGDHKSALAFSIPLIGLSFKDLNGHLATFEAWIDPNASDEFRVPEPGYDPAKSPDSRPCCNGKRKHLIVPYQPPMNPALYERVRGLQVTILVGTVLPDED